MGHYLANLDTCVRGNKQMPILLLHVSCMEVLHTCSMYYLCCKHTVPLGLRVSLTRCFAALAASRRVQAEQGAEGAYRQPQPSPKPLLLALQCGPLQLSAAN